MCDAALSDTEELEIDAHEDFSLLQPKFDGKSRCFLRDYNRRRVCLYTTTWETKTKKPERAWAVKFNFDKIIETLKQPDCVKKSKKNPESVLYYKKFGEFNIRREITVPLEQYMVVIVLNYRKVQTIYTTKRIKEGEDIWPPPK